MLKNLLETCGLNATEQKVFLLLSKSNKTLASVVARHCNLKRPTAYAALEALVQIGIVNKIKSGKITYFSVLKPELVAKVLQERARDHFEDISTASKLLAQVLTEGLGEKKDFGSFEVETFETMDLVYIQLEEALLSGNFCGIFNPELALTEKFKPLVWSFLDHSKKTASEIRELVAPGKAAELYKSKIQNPKHQVKDLPSSVNVKTDIIITSDAVFLNSYEKKAESSIKITEKNFHETMQSLFNLLWEK